MSESNIAQLQARLKDSMTSTSDGSVIPLQPGMTPEPRRKTPPKDHRAAARQAKRRALNRDRRREDRAGNLSDINGHREKFLSVPLPPPTVPVTTNVTAPVTVERLPKPRAGRAVDLTAYLAAIALAGAAAFFSVKGMVTLFPGAPLAIVAMAVAMEASKLVTAGWLAARWRATAWIWRGVLIVLVAGLAVINAAGVYAQLVSAHVGERGAATAAIETQDSALAARVEFAAHNVVDLDRRLGQIDGAIEEATRRGKTNAALSAIEGQKKARAGLAGERQREGATLADLKAERASVAAQGRRIETEAAPIRYVAAIFGVADQETAIRWLIALMVLCCDPLAIALTAAASARR
jgi:hypothetical protein